MAEQTRQGRSPVRLCATVICGTAAMLALGACGGDDGGGKKKQACTPEEIQCVGETTVRQCPEDGSAWVTYSCPEGESCEEEVGCSGSCQAAGDAECLDDSVTRVCDGKKWVISVCDAGATCSNGVCVAEEKAAEEPEEEEEEQEKEPEPEPEEEVEEVPEAEQPCNPDSTECLNATVLLICPSDGSGWIPVTCDDGECSDGACEVEGCTPGETSCSASNVRRECRADGSGYWDWPCSSEQRCEDGECEDLEIAEACAPGEISCAASNVRRECRADGTGYWEWPCPQGQICAEGECMTEEECTPGEISCAASNVRRECRADGSGYFDWPCPQGEVCSAGECVFDADQRCISGNVSCSGNTLYTCVADGTGWEASECPTDTVCDVIAGACMGEVCAPGVTACESNTQLRTCDADGGGWTVTQCQAGEACALIDDEVQCTTQQPPCVLGESQCGDAKHPDADEATQFSRCEPNTSAPFGRDWVLHVCEAPLSCDPAAPGCSSDCTPGDTRCSGDGVETCSEDGTWDGDVAACVADTVCTTQVPKAPGALCADVACAELAQQAATLPGEVSYRDDGVCAGGQIQRCDDDGHLTTGTDCEFGECTAANSPYDALGFNLGTCADVRECEPGSQRCVPGARYLYQDCGDDGRWDPATQNCGDDPCVEYTEGTGRLAIRCGGECNPGEIGCNVPGGVEGIRTCGSDGTWSAVVPCDSGACRQPVGYTEVVCIDECLPGEVVCLGDARTAANGTSIGTTHTGVCQNGRIPEIIDAIACQGTLACRTSATGLAVGCVECVGPDVEGGNELGVVDTRCTAATGGVETCGDGNDWGSPEACPAGRVCINDGPGAVCTPGDIYGFEVALGGEWATPDPSFSDDLPWTVSTGLGAIEPHSGSQMLATVEVGHSEAASVALTLDFPEGGGISFAVLPRSEATFDALTFFEDGVAVDVWSGDGSWTTQSYSVAPGVHTFTWRYLKDGSLDSHEDAAFIDDVVVTGALAP